ncbi:ATP-binding protein [Merdimonas faecis]
MINSDFLDFYESAAKRLALSASREEMACFLLDSNATEQDLAFMTKMLSMLLCKKQEIRERLFLNVSRLPKNMLMTFSRFKTESLAPATTRKIDMLRNLGFIDAKRNVIMIGPTGTGKTHLAMAIGYECCKNGIGAYFIKMKELQDKFHKALMVGDSGKALDSLTKYTCLILDEVGYCKFSKEETLLFFQLVDRFSSKEKGCIVLTSNKDIPLWSDLFCEIDALECALDRLCNNSISIRFSGSSNRSGSSELIEISYS